MTPAAFLFEKVIITLGLQSSDDNEVYDGTGPTTVAVIGYNGATAAAGVVKPLVVTGTMMISAKRFGEPHDGEVYIAIIQGGIDVQAMVTNESRIIRRGI